MSFGFGFGLPRAPLRGRPLVAAIRSLFAANEPGVWYDPSDLSTLYQDSAGTTPVTAVEQPVGLMLDKSKGLVLGVERYNFSGVGAVVGAAALTQTPTGYGFNGSGQSAGDASQRSWINFATDVGATYKIEFVIAGSDYLLTPGAGFFVRAGSSGTGTVLVTGSGQPSGVVSLIFTATSTTTNVLFDSNKDYSTYSVSNISVRELPGNHAYQTTATSRPVLSARYNLLTKTEQFDDAYWTKDATTVSTNGAVAPDGTLTADKLVETDATSKFRVRRTLSVGNSVAVTFSVYVKAAERGFIQLQEDTHTKAYVNFDIVNGTVISSAGGGTGQIVSVGNGWFRASLSLTTAATSPSPVWSIWITRDGFNGNYGTFGPSYVGDGTSGVYIWGASLVPANQAHLPYQRVNTATDYDADPAKFPHYLRFDGVDDWMVTNTITPGTDKVQVFAGVRKPSDGGTGAICELSADMNNNNGTAALFWDSSGWWRVSSKGTLRSNADFPEAGPLTRVLTGLAGIAGDSAILRVNGTQAASSTADQGTGNFLAYPLYIGHRGGTTLPFNGHLYSLIVRFGSNLPAAAVVNTEKYINTKTRAH